MKTSKTSRKIFKSRTLIILPRFPLENPNLEKKHLTPTLSFLSSEWLILLILLQYDLSLTWIVQSYFRKKLFELFPRSHLMLTLMLYSKVCKYWNSSSSWKVIGGGVGGAGGPYPPKQKFGGGQNPPPSHTLTHTHARIVAEKYFNLCIWQYLWHQRIFFRTQTAKELSKKHNEAGLPEQLPIDVLSQIDYGHTRHCEGCLC